MALPRVPPIRIASVLLLFCVAGHARDRAADPAPALTVPGTVAGKVIHVNDGDTLVLLDDNGHKRVVRFSDIDAPETSHGKGRPGQPFSAQATAHLKTLAHGQPAVARCFDVDVRVRDDGSRRDRYICQVSVGQLDLNLAMVDAGLAMAARQNKRYVRNPATLAREDAAKAARRGLWLQADPVPPWIWRRNCWEQQLCNGAGG